VKARLSFNFIKNSAIFCARVIFLELKGKYVFLLHGTNGQNYARRARADYMAEKIVKGM
jgi:hypothetical protein